MKKKWFYAVVILAIVGMNNVSIVLASSSYTNKENIPGASSTSDFVTYLGNIYDFGIALTGVLAVFMISAGAFMYIVSSAGNVSKMLDGKAMINDALFGLVLALVAYLLLYVVNPDLLSGTITGSTSTGKSSSTNTSSSGSSGSGSGSGKCEEVTTGSCSAENLKNTCFGTYGDTVVKQASAICNVESRGYDTAESGCDICKGDGKVFSVGLFQINMTCQCKDAFSPQRSSGCANNSCTVSDSTKYNDCVTKYKNPSNNIEKACELYAYGKKAKGNGWSQWGANSICGY